MELMEKSLDNLYQIVYCKLHDTIPEEIIGKMVYSVSLRKLRGPEQANKQNYKNMLQNLRMSFFCRL